MGNQWCHYCEERLDSYSSLEPPACMDCVNKALAQLKIANEDTARLDTVLENKWRLHRQMQNKWAVIGKNGADVFGYGRTPREAIDAARK